MRIDHCFLGDCRNSMREMLASGYAGKIQCIVTSPPYWGLRDYGVDGQLGLEPTPQEFVANMIEVFDLCRELLADDGVLWLNLGDSYAANRSYQVASTLMNGDATNKAQAGDGHGMKAADFGLKPKDLIGIPWRVAFALQADGWYLRQDIIWHKPNPMPESVTDRCTKSHEYLFLLTKRARYYFDQDAIKEDCSAGTHPRRAGNGYKTPDGWDTGKGAHGSFHKNGREKGRAPGNVNAPKGQAAYEAGDERHRTKAGLLDYAKRAQNRVKNNTSFDAEMAIIPSMRNKRSVWTIPTESFSEAHFATFPQALVEPCILAGSRPGDIVFDPFLGSGTVAQVAQRLGRHWIGCELNPKYIDLQHDRTRQRGLVLETA